MITTTPTDSIHKAILNLMDQETKRIVDEEAKNAAKRVEERVRGMTGEIATRIASRVNFEGGPNELRIIVSLDTGSRR